MNLHSATKSICILIAAATVLAYPSGAHATTYYYQGPAFDIPACESYYGGTCPCVSGSVTITVTVGSLPDDFTGRVLEDEMSSLFLNASGIGGFTLAEIADPYVDFVDGKIVDWGAGASDWTYTPGITGHIVSSSQPFDFGELWDNAVALACGRASGGGVWTNPKALGLPLEFPGQVCCGDPISLGTGNMYDTVTDYETAGQNKLTFERFYNSLASPITFASSLGSNWRSNYDRYLRFVSSTYIEAERTDGRLVSFDDVGGTWTPDSDVNLRMTSAGGTWTLTDADATVETYSSAGGRGRLGSIRLRGGYTQTLSYSSTTGALASVTDSYSRSLGFSYSSSTGLLTGVTTPDTLALTYGYAMFGSATMLTSVSYNTSPTTSQTYHYENTSFPTALTGITDENGNRYATWTYSDTGRVVMSEHASGADHTEISYDDSTNTRVVTGPLGIEETYTFTYLQGVPKITQIDRASNGSVDAATRTLTYDANGYLASDTDWNGNLTSYTNNSYGDPTTIVIADGSGVDQTTTIAYGSATYPNLPTLITTSGLIQTLNYDSSGRLLTNVLKDQASQSVPYFTSGTARTWTYTWNNTGQLLTAQLPRTDVTSKTTFAYTGGTLTSITDALSHATNILTYTSGGLPKTVTDQNSVLTTLAYNPRLWLTSSVLTLSGFPKLFRTPGVGDDASGGARWESESSAGSSSLKRSSWFSNAA